MKQKEKNILRMDISYLTYLINMEVWHEMIYMLIKFWDYYIMVFHFSGIKLTPTIEEVPNNDVLFSIIRIHQQIKDAFPIKYDT